MDFDTRKLADGWWVFGLEDGPMGPYATRVEADADRIGVQRFLAADKQGWKRGEKFIFGPGGRV